jgi:hypothetical protein
MVAQLAPDEFLFMGASVSVIIRPTYGSGYTAAQYLRAEEGTYQGGVWKASAVRNGNITALSLPAAGAMMKVKLTRY